MVHSRDGGDLLPCSGAPLEDHDAARLRRFRGDGPPGRGPDRRHPRAPPLCARAPELGRLPSGRVSLRARSPPQGQTQVHGLAAPGLGGLGDRVVFRRPAPAGGARGRRNLGALARGRTCRAAQGDAGPRRRRGRACVLLRAPAPGDRHARRVRRPCPRGGPEPPDLRRRRGRRVGSDPGRARSRGRMSGRTALRLAGCLGLSAVLAFYQLGERPLSSPAEARYALIARAMLDDGDWVQPRLNGVRYYEKPPLLYWSVAASYRLFGQTEGASRVPSAVAYVATVAVTLFLARQLLLGARDAAFLRFYLVNEHLLRFFNAREPIDYTPLAIGGFWLASILWLLPWSLFLPAALASADLRKALALPLVWSAWVIAFFTTSGSRLEYYALPAFPALAVVVAAYWRGAIDARPSRAGVRVPAWMVLFFGVAVLSWLVLFRQSAAESLTLLFTLLDGVYREYFAHHREASFAFVEDCLRLVLPFAVFIVVLGGAAVLASRLPRARLAFPIWLAGAVGLLRFVELGHRLVAPDRSQRDLAPIIRKLWEPRAELVVWGNYEDYCGVSLYTGYPTRMLDGAGGDLLFGYHKGDAPGLFLTREELERLWASSGRVFVVGDRGRDLPGAVRLATGPRFQLVTNRP